MILLKKNKELLKYFDKSNIKEYCVKEKCKNFSINKYFLVNVFDNFLYNKEI